MTVTTRFYPSFSTAGFIPSNNRGAWDDVSDADPGWLLGRTKSSNSGATTSFESVSTNNWDIQYTKFISDAFTAAVSITSADTLAWVLGVKQSSNSMNAFWHVHAYITAGDTDTVRGAVLSNFIGSTEFTTTATGRGEGAKTLSPVSAQAGDRLVVEIGAQCQNTSTSGFNSALNAGGTGSDLTQGSTSVTTNPGWFDLVTATDPFGAGGVEVPAPAAALSISGGIPQIASGSLVSVSAAPIGILGAIPAITTGAKVAAAVVAVSLFGIAPSISGGAAVAVPAATTGITGLSPGIFAGVSVAVPGVAISITGLAPTLPSAAVIAVPAAQIETNTFAPAVHSGARVSSPAYEIVVAGNVPAVVAGSVTITVPAANENIATLAPVIRCGASVSPTPGVIISAAFAPSILAWGPPPPSHPEDWTPEAASDLQWTTVAPGTPPWAGNEPSDTVWTPQVPSARPWAA